MNDFCGKVRTEAVAGVMGRLFIVSLSVCFMSGCAGKPPATFSSLRMEAVRHNQRGIKAEARGDSARALEEFHESLRINRSIENGDGIIVSLVNSSRVHRRNGDAKAALNMINGAVSQVEPRSPLYPEVAFEMAQVLLLSGELDEAAAWASKAVDADNGGNRGMGLNLLARILFLQGDPAGAEAKVREALLLNGENDFRHEEANSLRLLGELQLHGKRSAEAAESYTRALAIDKALGKSSKIAADLRALARLSLSMDDLDRALSFYQRSVAVSSASGDRQGAADDLLKMSRIHEKQGDNEQSGRRMAEREALLKNGRTP